MRFNASHYLDDSIAMPTAANALGVNVVARFLFAWLCRWLNVTEAKKYDKYVANYEARKKETVFLVPTVLHGRRSQP
jgi:hypothetical protein